MRHQTWSKLPDNQTHLELNHTSSSTSCGSVVTCSLSVNDDRSCGKRNRPTCTSVSLRPPWVIRAYPSLNRTNSDQPAYHFVPEILCAMVEQRLRHWNGGRDLNPSHDTTVWQPHACCPHICLKPLKLRPYSTIKRCKIKIFHVQWLLKYRYKPLSGHSFCAWDEWVQLHIKLFLDWSICVCVCVCVCVYLCSQWGT